MGGLHQEIIQFQILFGVYLVKMGPRPSMKTNAKSYLEIHIGSTGIGKRISEQNPISNKVEDIDFNDHNFGPYTIFHKTYCRTTYRLTVS